VTASRNIHGKLQISDISGAHNGLHRRFTVKHISLLWAVLLMTVTMFAQSAPSIQSATLGESGAKTPEISTEELRRAFEEKSANVFDVRPSLEFAISR
jgi:hypothetical protein